MPLNSASPDRLSSGGDDDNAAGGGGGLGLSSIHDRILFKRNPNPTTTSSINNTKDRTKTAPGVERHWRAAGRSHHQGRSPARRFLLFLFRGRSLFYFCILFALFAFALASMVLESSIASVFSTGSEKGRSVQESLKFGCSLKFEPWRLDRGFGFGLGLVQLRSEPRIGARPPRLALILGNMDKDSLSLMLYTVMKNLQELGYMLKIYAVEKGKAHSMWEKIGGQISILSPERFGHIDWSMYVSNGSNLPIFCSFEGIIVDSLDAKHAISSLMQEPFCSVPLIWIIQEDTLANRLPMYKDMGWEHLISFWKNAFSWADVNVFPDFSLPMLYSVLDTGNFFVIPGSPIDVWAAESYSITHSKIQLRTDNGFNKDDMLVLVVGSSFFYNELSWDYAVAMHDIGPLLIKYARGKGSGGAFKFLFLCGNSTDGYSDA